MSGLEAAASLFGSEDAGSDPFASLGSDDQPPIAAHGANDDLFSVNDVSAAPDFSVSSQAYSGPAVSQDPVFQPAEQHSSWPETNGYDPNLQSVPPTSEQSYGGYGAQSSYDEQWQSHSQPASYAPAFTNGNTQAAQTYNAYTPSQHYNASQSYTASTLSQSTYDSYAPPAPSTAANVSQAYAPTSVPASQSVYEPYAPPAQQKATAAHSYNPVPAASPQTTYNTYAPPPQSTYGVPSYTSSQNVYGYQNAAITAAVPPPPAPKVPLNRPKVSNAYDPPFPTTTSRKSSRNSAAPTNHYSSFSPPPPQLPVQRSVPPPPPRAAQTPVQSFHSGDRPVSNSNTYSLPSPVSNGSQSKIDGLPHTNGFDATYSTYALSPTNSTLDAQHSTPLNQANDDFYALPHEKTEPEINETAVEDPYIGLSSGVQDYQRPNNIPVALNSSMNTASPPTSYRNSSPETSTLPPRSESPFKIHSPPAGGPPKRASSAASFRPPPPRTQSPLSGGSELSRPRSSNSGIRTSHIGLKPHSGVSLDLYSPKIGQIPEESNLSNGVATSLDFYAPSYRASLPSSPEILPFGSPNPSNPYTPTANQASSISSPPPPRPPPQSRGSYDVNPYLPNSKPVTPPHNRSMSNGSILSTLSEDPYAPSKFQSGESYTSRYNYLDNDQASPNPGSASSGISSLGPPQDIKAPTYTPYAPSPSLLGTNDPLGRAGARVPVFSFGFGGKFVTCFHGADKMNTGFDVALASRNSTGVEIRALNKIIPNSALNLSSVSFPGPLFSDPGSPTIGLVRPGAAAQAKTKKARVVKYLEDRVEEFSQGLGYVPTGSEDQGRTESKLILFKILKVLVENDGKLSGTPSMDAAVRAALVPQTGADPNGAESSNFTSVADLQGADGTLMGLSNTSSSGETPISITTLRPSALNKIERFLLHGERRQAYHYALDQKLWSHAMIIASGIDKEAWQEVVNEFLKTELGTQAPSMGPSNGRESLRVVYSLLSGQGAKAVHQLVPKTSLSNPAAVLLAPMTVSATPMTPNFSVPMPAANIPAESLSKWAEIVAMMLSSTVNAETSATMTALGDQLAGNGWTEAAHVCYLLSPQTSTVAGSQHPSARIVLLGARNPHLSSNFLSDPDPIILSEIHEFALSLAPVSKGQEAFGGLPHLQVYRFIRAIGLAELGEVSISNRYCEAITASMNRPSAYYTNVMLEQLKGLSDRIVGVTQADKGGSWMGSKLAKPSLDGIGGWLEGRFAKLVTGDMESPTATEHQREKTDERGFVGPFSQYSTISSTTTSTTPSPQSSVVNLNAYAPPPPRTGSALSTRSLAPPNGSTERASSAIDHSRQRLQPSAPRVTSANASTTTFSQAQSRSFGQATAAKYPTSPNDLLTPRPALGTTEEDEGQEVTWWGSGNAATPTTASFVQLSGSALTPTVDGFISFMDNHDHSIGSTYQAKSDGSPIHNAEEEEEDLGFGNSKPKPKSASDDADKSGVAKTEEHKAAPARPDINPSQAQAAPSSGSWLSRLWKRESTPGPVKASLGEESSFYYDKELKKWVNKKVGSEDVSKPATPPPPPSRAQTTSPGGVPRPASGPPLAGMRPPSAGPPPPRAASAMDNPPSAGKPPMRVRSNLVPSDEGGPGSAPSTPTGSRLAPPGPPPGRPRSQASKRNVRSRYVDVFQQESSS
ncbi:Sec23-binding domain of Sec16-domain-containing protein [Lentinula edodes]|uniref:Sec23-binding domain of Sec16-domain-containing protein n=1 Tax=Lentinula edodes TaxID=5353 RepID=UPI001E8D0839|nr:Sec23-binding domain of Sec16-domain-containing protein [Lentinula edodes]KAH7871832.1 Sec23-binding domain of Sec16-domain-containing protein [Lentinula edodes]